MHGAASVGRCVGVDAARQQRMCESQSVAVDLDDAVPFGFFQGGDGPVDVAADRTGDDVDRGRRQRGRGEQGVPGELGQFGDARPHQLGDRAGQRRCTPLSRSSARANSSAWKGFPADTSWIHAIFGRVRDRPSRWVIIACSPPTDMGCTWARCRRSGRDGSHRSSARSASPARTVTRNPMGPADRRTTDAMTSAVAGSSHCTSSIATRTGPDCASRSTTDRIAAATAR